MLYKASYKTRESMLDPSCSIIYRELEIIGLDEDTVGDLMFVQVVVESSSRACGLSYPCPRVLNFNEGFIKNFFDFLIDPKSVHCSKKVTQDLKLFIE